MEPTEEHASSDNQTVSMEDTYKQAALAVAFCYTVGLLTANAFLFRHGTSDFSLLRPKALLTGALALCSLGAIAFGPIQVASLIVEPGISSGEKWLSTTLRLIRNLVLPWMVLVAIGTWIIHVGSSLGMLNASGTKESIPLLPGAGIATQLYVSASCVSIVFIQVIRFYRCATTKKTFAEMSRNWAKLLIYVSFLTLMLGWYIAIFANFVYVIIPGQFGGGRPETVSFAINSSSVPALRQLRINFAGVSNVTCPLTVLHEDEDSVTVEVTYDYDFVPNPNDWLLDVEGFNFKSSATAVTINKKLIEASVVDFAGFKKTFGCH